LHKPAILAFT